MFRFFIDDLARDLRQAQGKGRGPSGDSVSEPGKLVADDVILVARSEEEMQKLLDVCTHWASRNKLNWKPAKCSIVMERATGNLTDLNLAGNHLKGVKEAKYLGITVSGRGFSKKLDKELEAKCRTAWTATTSQSFFDVGLPLKTITTLYRKNVCSIIIYETALLKSIDDLVDLDNRMLQSYLKRIIHAKPNLSQTLLDRLCIRIRMPILLMDIERLTRVWTVKLGRASRTHHTEKVKKHAQDALNAITKLPQEVPARRYFTRGPFEPKRWEVQEFKSWRTSTLSDSAKPRVIDRVTKSVVEDDILDSNRLTVGEKRSGWRYLVYRFPLDTTAEVQEDAALSVVQAFFLH